MSGILDHIVNDAVDIAELRTVVRTPTVPVLLQQEPTNVFEQMDTPVCDWCMEPFQQTIQTQVHNRPVTPNIRSLRSKDSWPRTPRGTPSRPRVGGTPSSMPSRPSKAVPTVSPNIARGISLDEGGLPMEQAGLTETYMQGRPPVDEGDAEAVKEVPSGQDTSAKELVGDSPKVALWG